MQNPEKIPEPVFVYPLPTKTQGEHGNSKAYRISLWILWLCFLLPIIGIVFNIDVLIFSYVSTNIFIIFFVVYFEFYKNRVFQILVLVTAVLVLPAAHATSFITPFIPNFSPRGFGEGYPYFEFNFAIGIVFFFASHAVNLILNLSFRKSIAPFITPLILCGVGSFFFYFACFAIFGRIFEKFSEDIYLIYH